MRGTFEKSKGLTSPKTARYQARIYLADPLVFACRVFAVLLLERQTAAVVFGLPHKAQIRQPLFIGCFYKFSQNA